MIKLGVIGTNWITHQFVQAAQSSNMYQLTSVYSRKIETAQDFAENYDAKNLFTDLEAFLSSEDIDVVYIASPNSLHYKQAKAAIHHGKHVIVEKPAVSTSKELRELLKMAESQHVFYFEAARNVHEENFQYVKDLLPEPQKIIGANFSYMKYSSRYDLVLQGEEPAIFSPEYSGGALMDLGVYLLYASVALFGQPESSHYFSQKIQTGVDGIGTMMLRYKGFDVTLLTGKIGNSFLPSEIYTTETTIQMNAVNSIDKVSVYSPEKGLVEGKKLVKEENPMIEEARDFAQVIMNPTDTYWQIRYHEWLKWCQIVHDIMEDMRREAGIVFAADKYER